MMRLQTYGAVSFIAALAVIYHAFSSREQFYPSMIYVSTSKVNLVLLLNMGLVIMCIMWQLTKRIFLGSLREAEIERLNEQSWREVMEILFAITIFRQDLSVPFLAMLTALLLIKALHWLAQKRVDYIETTPSVPMLSHVRIVSFIGFLLLLDSLFLYNSVKYLIQTRQASVSVFFSFEYMILATTTVATFVKYTFFVADMLMEGQWEKKAVYTFYLELVRDLVHLTMYMCFFLVIFVSYGVPLHLIRELYETFRNFKIRIADYIRYRKITSNMNDRFPDATPEELTSSDATCIICREEMTTAKKLVCGHLFHVHCLRSWLERQHTCPTCRAHVIPTDSGTNAATSRAEAHQQGGSTARSSSQGTTADGGPIDNISRHQTRLQAAAAAASIYQKSYVYPSQRTLVWSPGYTSLTQGANADPNGPQSSTPKLQNQFAIPVGTPNLPSAQFPGDPFIPFQPPGLNTNFGDGLNSSNLTLSVEAVEAQKKIIKRQIELMHNQLHFLQNVRPLPDKGTDRDHTGVSDSKGKAVGSSSSSSSSSSTTTTSLISDFGQHGKTE